MKTMRCRLVSLFCLTALIVFVTCNNLKAAEPSSRPNILWITCEDMSCDLGCWGDDFAISPNIDRLAARGVRYTNAYGITGVCAVNRSCIITGCYSSSLGSQDMRSRTRLPEAVKCFSEILRGAGYYCTNQSKTDYNFSVPPNAWDACSGKAHWRGRAADQPFFAVINFTITHESQYRQSDASFFKKTARLTAEQRHGPDKTPIPPFHPDTPESRQDWSRYYDCITAMDYQVGDVLAHLEADGLADDTIVFFYSDHGVGMPGCKKWVWDAGLRVPMIVYVPERFKQYAPGAAGTATDRLVSFVDLAPTALSLVGIEPPEAMQGRPFLGKYETTPREFVFGIRDRMAERFDTVRLVRDKRFQYIRNYRPDVSWSQYVSYTEMMPTMKVWRQMAYEGKLNPVQARYFLPTKPVEELYDTATDRWQVNNLADNPKYASVLARMRAECEQRMRETGDLGLLPEYEMTIRSAGRTPWDLSRDAEKNPIARLQKAADLANNADADKLPQLIGLTQDADSAIRWWGAIGLRTHAAQDASSVSAESIEKLLDDVSPNVKVVAAETLIQLGQKEKGRALLLEMLKHPSSMIRLRAIAAFERTGDEAEDTIAAIRAAKMPGAPFPSDYLNRMTDYYPHP